MDDEGAGSTQLQIHESLLLVSLAILLGIATGLGVLLFRGLVALLHNLSFLGHFNFIYYETLHPTKYLKSGCDFCSCDGD